MKKLFFVVIMLFISITGYGQVAYEPGWLALYGGFKVGALNGTSYGGTIGGKYYLSDKSAFRFGIEGLKINDLDDDVLVTNRYATDDLVKADLYGGYFDYLYYIQSEKHVKLFLGGGPTLGKYKREYKHINPSDWPVEDDDYRSTYDQWYIGIDGRVGLEWLATKNFGISVEYSLSFKYFDGDYDSYYVVKENELTEDGWKSSYETVKKSGKKSSSNVYANQFLLGFNIYL